MGTIVDFALIRYQSKYKKTKFFVYIWLALVKAEQYKQAELLLISTEGGREIVVRRVNMSNEKVCGCEKG